MDGRDTNNSQSIEQSFETESDCSEQISDIILTCESNDSSGGTPNKKFKIFGFESSQIKWSNVVWLIVIHSLAVYAYIHALINPVKIWTLVFVSIIAALSGFGMSGQVKCLLYFNCFSNCFSICYSGCSQTMGSPIIQSTFAFETTFSNIPNYDSQRVYTTYLWAVELTAFSRLMFSKFLDPSSRTLETIEHIINGQKLTPIPRTRVEVSFSHI